MSPKIIDLSGKTFGRWKVLSLTSDRDSDGSVMWQCQCECGVLRKVSSNSLRRGISTSCGCYARERTADVSKRDIKGKKFGYLTAIKPTPFRTSFGSIMWECICKCGRTTHVSATALLFGSTQSCGCYAKEITKKVNTTHGMSHTKSWRRWVNRKRRHLQNKLDCGWTYDMEMFLRDMYKKCVLCGSTTDLAVDHVLPISLGNGLYPGNATILCRSCNSHKSNKTLSTLPLEHQAKILWSAYNFVIKWQQYTYEN